MIISHVSHIELSGWVECQVAARSHSLPRPCQRADVRYHRAGGFVDDQKMIRAAAADISQGIERPGGRMERQAADFVAAGADPAQYRDIVRISVIVISSIGAW